MEAYFGAMGVAWKVVADASAPMEALNLVEQRVGICILSRTSAGPHPALPCGLYGHGPCGGIAPSFIVRTIGRPF